MLPFLLLYVISLLLQTLICPALSIYIYSWNIFIRLLRILAFILLVDFLVIFTVFSSILLLGLMTFRLSTFFFLFYISPPIGVDIPPPLISLFISCLIVFCAVRIWRKMIPFFFNIWKRMRRHYLWFPRKQHGCLIPLLLLNLHGVSSSFSLFLYCSFYIQNWLEIHFKVVFKIRKVPHTGKLSITRGISSMTSASLPSPTSCSAA